MVQITRTYKRTRRVTEFTEITLDLPEFYTDQHKDDTFLEHATHDRSLTWDKRDEADTIAAVHHHSTEDDQDPDEDETRGPSRAISIRKRSY